MSNLISLPPNPIERTRKKRPTEGRNVSYDTGNIPVYIERHLIQSIKTDFGVSFNNDLLELLLINQF